MNTTMLPSPEVDSSEITGLLSTLARDGYCVMKAVIPGDEVHALK